MDTKAMFKIPYGLYVLTAKSEEKDNGCIINTLQQVTAQPNRISIAVNKLDYTHDMIVKSGMFNVSTIGEKAGFDLFRHFGFQSGRDVDKFAGYSNMKRSANGLYYITGCTNAFISGKVEQMIDLGTHTLFIADVTDLDVLDENCASATYTYYQEHIKPKPQDTGAKTGQVVWRCRICGYEYIGEELPADFICPICKHPASDFEKIIR